MLFNSYIFILAFLPLCLLGWFGLNRFKFHKLAQVFLLGMSLWFYGYFNAKYLAIIVSSVLINYCIYRSMSRFRAKKMILLLGLVFNIGLLLCFKYLDFFISVFNQITGTEHTLLNILLPLGISFFTFQQISFIVDSYKGEVPNYGFLEYACFVTYFPQLIAGPIVTHDELVPQFQEESRKRLDWENFSKGIYLFSLGLAKKVLIADTFGNVANIGYADISALDATNAIITMLSYTIQIYFDFSGYCDMAIGIGKMMNIDLPLNFDSPYKSLTITEFWDRWHMTLTRFFTRYVYIPLGGSRNGEWRTYRNIFIVFFISGFWHGAGYTFIVWGVCHGIFSIITRRFRRFFETLHPALNWIITFGFVNVMWVFFRADTLGDALRLLNRIARCRFGAINTEMLACFKPTEIELLLKLIPKLDQTYPYFAMAFLFVLAILLLLGGKNAYERMQAFRPTAVRVFTTAGLLVWSIFSFAGVSTFLYFNF